MIDNLDQEDPFAKYGGKNLKKEDKKVVAKTNGSDPFAKYGGSSLKKKGASELTEKEKPLASPTQTTQEPTSSDIDQSQPQSESDTSAGPPKFRLAGEKTSNNLPQVSGLYDEAGNMPVSKKAVPVKFAETPIRTEDVRSMSEKIDTLSNEIPKTTGAKKDQKQVELDNLKEQRNNELYDGFIGLHESTDEDRSLATQEESDKFKTKGFWNTTNDIFKKSWNTFVDVIGVGGEEATKDTWKVETDPTKEFVEKANKEFNDAIVYYKKAKLNDDSIEIPKYDAEKINKRAFEIAVEENLAEKKQARINSFMRDVEDKGLKGILTEYNDKEYKTVSESDKKLLDIATINKLALNKSNENILRLAKQLKDLHAAGMNPSPELIDQITKAQANNNTLILSAAKANDDYTKKHKELGSFEENLDILNRDYDYGTVAWGNIDAVGGEIVRGLLGMENYMGRLTAATGLPNPVTVASLGASGGKSNNLLRDWSKATGESIEEIKGSIEKPIESKNISSASDFGRWLTNSVIIPTSSFIGQASMGPAGMSALVAESIGNTHEGMLDQMDAGDANYSEAQLLGVPVAKGAVDAALFVFTDGLLKGTQRAIKAANAAEKELIAESVLKHITKKQLHGAAVMNGITIAKNAVDKYSGVDPNKNLLEGTLESTAVSIATVGILDTAPKIAIKVASQFSLDNHALDASNRIISLEKSLTNNLLSDENRVTINEQLAKAKEDLNGILKRQIRDISSLSDKQYQEVVKLNTDRSNLFEKAKRIKEDQSLDKATKGQLYTGLKQELNILENRRRSLVNNGPTIQLENLSPELATSLRDKARVELEKEYDKAGKPDIIVPDNEIDKRAMVIHNEKAYEAKSTEPIIEEKNGIFYATNKEGITKGFDTKEAADAHLGKEAKVSQQNEDVSYGFNEPTVPALKDVESTTKALDEFRVPSEKEENVYVQSKEIDNLYKLVNNKFIKELKKSIKGKGYYSEKEIISESYHKAKADGSNPKLVNAVEELLGKPIEKNEGKNMDEFYKIHGESYKVTDKAHEDLRNDKITGEEYNSILQNEESKIENKLNELKDKIGDNEYKIVRKNSDINWHENQIYNNKEAIKEIENKKNPTQEDLKYKKRLEQDLERNKQEALKAKEELKALKEAKPTEIKAEEVKLAEPKSLAKEYIESIEKVKAEDPEKFWSVDKPFKNEDGTINEAELNKAAEEGRLIKTEAGFGVVGEDGDIKGVFKSDVKSTEKTGDKVIQESVKAGGVKLDNFALPNLMKIYERNGFREVSRLPFSEEVAPEGWNKEQHGTPDVVAMVYDPQGKLNIEKKSFTDYDEAMKYRDSYVEEAKKPAEVKPEIKSKLDAFKAKHIDKPVFDRTKLDKQIENAKKSIVKILPNVKFVVHDTRESFVNESGKNARGYYDPKTNTIHINALDANSRTVYHEVFHPLLMEKLKTDVNVREFTKKMISALSRTLDYNPELKKTLDDFVTKYDENLKSEEKVTELFANLADGYEGFDAPTKSLIKKFIDRVATMFGLKPFTEGDVVDVLKTLAGKLSAGEEISVKDVKIFKGGKKVDIPSEGLTKRFSYGNDKVALEIKYLEQDKIEELKQKGLLTEPENLSSLNGKKVVTTSPDDMLVGSIYVNGKEVATGNGGVYFVTKFGDVWANSNKGVANGLAREINETYDPQTGKSYLALVKGTDAKLVSSPQGVTSSLAVTESMIEAGLFSLSDFRSAVRSAVKSNGGDIKLSPNGSAKVLKSEVDSFFKDVTSSTFEKRGNVLRDIVSNLAKSESAKNNKVEIINFLDGDKSKGLGVGKTEKSQSLIDLVAKTSAEKLTKGLKTGDVYAIVEIDGKVKVVQDNHQSYPYHIKIVDENGNISDKKPVLILPKNRRNGREILTSIDGKTAEELGSGFAGKVGATANMPYGKGIIMDKSEGKFQESENYSDMKDIVKDMMDDGKSIEEIKKVIGSELGQDQVSLAERAHNELTEPPKTTSIKNAVVASEREAQGKEPVEQREKYSAKDNFENTKAKVDSGEIFPRDLASAIVNNPKSVPITSEVSDALTYDRMKLSNEYDQALKNIVENPNDPTYITARDRIEREIEENDKASRYSGTISSHALLARKNVIKQDYSLERMVLRYKAATGGEISNEMRAKFETMSKKLEEANAKVEKYESKEAEKLAEKVLNDIKKDIKQQGKTINKENLKVERDSLYAKLRDIRLSKGKFQEIESNELPESFNSILNKLAKNLIMDGINTLDAVVTEIHENVKDIFEGVTERDIRDALSGYGKVKLPSKDEIDVQLREIKSQGRLVSAYEDAQAGNLPLKTGFQREAPSDRVRELQREVQEMMKQNGITRESVSPESTWKTALDGIKTRLKNQIRDLEKQIATGEKTPKKTGVAYDAEANVLKEQRDGLKKIIEDTEGKTEMSDEQRVKVAISAVEKSITEYERRISERDITPKEKGTKTPETPELKTLRDIRENLKKEYEQIKEEIDPKRTPEERALAAIKTRLNNRAKELQDMLDSGNFEKKARTVTELDPEAMALKANVERIKSKVDLEIKKEQLKNRTNYEKTLDFVSSWRRSMLLTGFKVIGKLQTAAMTRTAISPIEEITGGVFSKIPGISKISKKAPRQGGGFNTKAEVAAISQWWKKATYKDMKDTLMSGKGELELLHGKKNDLPPSVLDYFGQLHQALKQPAKRNEYFRSFEKRLAHAKENGIDISDSMVQATIGAQAYIDANRAIFMQENLATKAYKTFVSSLERGGNIGKTSAAGLKIILPIVKVPTNFVGEVTSYAGGYAKALPLIGKAIFKGVDSLTPEQADYVMRNLKKGSVGAAFIALGYFNPSAVGGYYQRGEKRKEEEVDAGGLRLFGDDLPKWMVHTPLLECLQVGSTLRRVQDSYEKKGKEEGGLASGLSVAKGLVEEVPFARSPEEAIRALTGVKEAKKYARDLGESMINPQLTKELGLEILPEVGKKGKKLTDEELKVKYPEVYKRRMERRKASE